MMLAIDPHIGRSRSKVARRCMFAAAQICEVDATDVASQLRTPEVFAARAIIAWIMVRAFSWSLPRTGLYLSRHHTTVLHAVRYVDAAIAKSTSLRGQLEATIDLMVAHSREIQK